MSQLNIHREFGYWLTQRSFLISASNGGLFLRAPRLERDYRISSVVAGVIMTVFTDNQARRGHRPKAGSQEEAICEKLLEAGLLNDRADGGNAEDELEVLDQLILRRSPFGSRRTKQRPCDPSAHRRPEVERGVMKLPPAWNLTCSLTASIGARRTQRGFQFKVPAPALEWTHVSTLLAHTAKVEPSTHQEILFERKPIISGGGLPALDIFVCAFPPMREMPEMFRYVPEKHELKELDTSVDLARLREDMVCRIWPRPASPPACVFVVHLNVGPTYACYEGMALPTLYRNAGAFLQQMSLVASAIGRPSCAVGGLGRQFCTDMNTVVRDFYFGAAFSLW